MNISRIDKHHVLSVLSQAADWLARASVRASQQQRWLWQQRPATTKHPQKLWIALVYLMTHLLKNIAKTGYSEKWNYRVHGIECLVQFLHLGQSKEPLLHPPEPFSAVDRLSISLFQLSFTLKIWPQWENDFVARFLRTLQISAIHFFQIFSVSAVFLTIFEDGAGTIMVCVEAAVPKHRAPTQVETRWVTARLSLSSRQVSSAILIPTKVFVDFQINWLLKMVAKG